MSSDLLRVDKVEFEKVEFGGFAVDKVKSVKVEFFVAVEEISNEVLVIVTVDELVLSTVDVDIVEFDEVI